jgi:putative transposase
LADEGAGNVNAAIDALIETGVLRRLLAFTELKFSNSMIESLVAFPEAPIAVPTGSTA